MFRFVFNDYGAPERRDTGHLFKNSEAGEAGQAVKLEDGRYTLASETDEVAGFLIGKVKAGTDQPCGVIIAREGDWFDVPYTGTPDAGFTEGANAVALSEDGLSVDSETVTGGAIAVYEINTEQKTCRIKVKNRQFS